VVTRGQKKRREDRVSSIFKIYNCRNIMPLEGEGYGRDAKKGK